jgi:hypothetical protein
MSTTPAAAPQRQAPRDQLSGQNEIRIVSHSTLFYWWPVWAIGFLMAIITWFDGHHMVVVPSGTEKVRQGGHDVLVAPEKHPDLPTPRLLMADNKNLGVIFTIVILLVITITNIQLRGLWSVIVIVVIIFLSIIFGLIGWWEKILGGLELLDIRINLAGYLVMSVVLLGIWLITLLLFDQQVYMVFTPGQLRVRLEIGEGETAYDTTGMTIQKQRSDLFRHWILGLGSGDLIVRTSGAQVHHFDLPNVLFLGRKVKDIEQMLRSRPVVRGPA